VKAAQSQVTVLALKRINLSKYFHLLNFRVFFAELILFGSKDCSIKKMAL
jgi:hypothetical protein